MNRFFTALLGALLLCAAAVSASELSDSVKKDYDAHLGDLWDHFHRNPELSLVEFRTAERMANELRAAGFDVTEQVGGTGVVARDHNDAHPGVPTLANRLFDTGTRRVVKRQQREKGRDA